MEKYNFNQTDLPTIGKKLKVFRKLAGLSQFDVETAAKLSNGSISRLENDLVNPSKETIYILSKVYNLDLPKIDYLIGTSATLPSQEEIKDAQESIRSYMEKNFTLAYMMDERGRLFYISKGFRTLAKISDEQHKNLIFVPMPLIILEDKFGIKKFLEGENYEKIIKVGFFRTFIEIHFMKGDPVFEVIKQAVNKHKITREFWKNLENNIDIPVIDFDLSRVPFNYNGIKIELEFRTEKLISNPRFKILYYNPTNKLLKLIKSLV